MAAAVVGGAQPLAHQALAAAAVLAADECGASVAGWEQQQAADLASERHVEDHGTDERLPRGLSAEVQRWARNRLAQHTRVGVALECRWLLVKAGLACLAHNLVPEQRKKLKNVKGRRGTTTTTNSIKKTYFERGTCSG